MISHMPWPYRPQLYKSCRYAATTASGAVAGVARCVERLSVPWGAPLALGGCSSTRALQGKTGVSLQ